MTRVEIDTDRLRVEVLGWDKLWAFKNRLDFPLEHVAGVRRWNKGMDRMTWRWIRAPGTHLPGVITAGTYHGNGEHVFYDVHDFKNAMVIELRDEWYARLIIEVPEPEALLGTMLTIRV
jgi:hypothetical protein